MILLQNFSSIETNSPSNRFVELRPGVFFTVCRRFEMVRSAGRSAVGIDLSCIRLCVSVGDKFWSKNFFMFSFFALFTFTSASGSHSFTVFHQHEVLSFLAWFVKFTKHLRGSQRESVLRFAPHVVVACRDLATTLLTFDFKISILDDAWEIAACRPLFCERQHAVLSSGARSIDWNFQS